MVDKNEEHPFASVVKGKNRFANMPKHKLAKVCHDCQQELLQCLDNNPVLATQITTRFITQADTPAAIDVLEKSAIGDEQKFEAREVLKKMAEEPKETLPSFFEYDGRY